MCEIFCAVANLEYYSCLNQQSSLSQRNEMKTYVWGFETDHSPKARLLLGAHMFWAKHLVWS